MSEWLARAADSDIWWSFKSSSLTVVAAAATLFIVVVAFLSPVLAPHTPFDPATLSLSDGLKPPPGLNTAMGQPLRSTARCVQPMVTRLHSA